MPILAYIRTVRRDTLLLGKFPKSAKIFQRKGRASFKIYLR